MDSPLRPGEIVIDDLNYVHHLAPVVDGETKGRGLYPRDWRRKPFGCFAFAPPFSIPIIDPSKWQPILDAQVTNKSQLSNLRDRGNGGQPIPSRDQNGKGYCWAHSGVSAHLLARAAANLPYADLSAYAIACIIKGYRDQGGNGDEGIQFQVERGCPTSKFWPQQSMSRSNDNPQTWADAAKHKYTVWMELDPRQMKAQLATCYLLNIPTTNDYNRWSHSVAGADLVSVTPFKHRIWNSWSDSYSAQGMGVLDGESWLPDNAWACVGVSAALAAFHHGGDDLLLEHYSTIVA